MYQNSINASSHYLETGQVVCIVNQYNGSHLMQRGIDNYL